MIYHIFYCLFNQIHIQQIYIWCMAKEGIKNKGLSHLYVPTVQLFFSSEHQKVGNLTQRFTSALLPLPINTYTFVQDCRFSRVPGEKLQTELRVRPNKLFSLVMLSLLGIQPETPAVRGKYTTTTRPLTHSPSAYFNMICLQSFSLTPKQKNKVGKIIILYDEDERLTGPAATTFVQREVDNLFVLSGGNNA